MRTLYYWLGGPRESLAGVPTRDLTQADLDRLTPRQMKDLRGSSLYTTHKPVKASPPVTETVQTHEPAQE